MIAMAKKKSRHPNRGNPKPIVKNKVSLCKDDTWGDGGTGLPFDEGTYWFGKPSPLPVDCKAIWRNRKYRVRAGENLRIVLQDEGMSDALILDLLNSWYRDGVITPETYRRARDL